MILIKGIAIRFYSLAWVCLSISTVIAAHNDLLPFSPKVNGTLELLSLCIIAVNNAAISRYKERK